MSLDTNHLPHGAGVDAVFDAARTIGLTIGARSFIFCRHGQTAGNAMRVYQHAHEPLDAEGHAQAIAAGAAIAAGPRPTRLLASDMARAWLTAGHIAAATGLAVQATPGLRERSFGTLVGGSSAGFDWRIAPPGGETLATFVGRTVAALSDALAGDDSPLLVAHGGTLLVLAGALGLRLDQALRANAVPLLLQRDAEGWAIRRLVALPGP
jgi:probable phosphoglycerate mutase